MKIKTFQRDEYRGCPIYYRNFYFHFEYLVVIKGEFYTAHITVSSTPINRLLYWLKIEPNYYSQQQYNKIIPHLRKMAETTIETILAMPQLDKK